MARIKGKVQSYHITRSHAQPPGALQHPHQSATIFIVGDPVLTHHRYPKCIVYVSALGFTLGIVHYVGPNKWIVTCIYH